MPIPKKRAGTPIANFDTLQHLIRLAPQSDEVGILFLEIGQTCLSYLQQFPLQELTTHIQDKQYFAFVSEKRFSRAVNQISFYDIELVKSLIQALQDKKLTQVMPSASITRACYTLAMSFACVVDLINPGDKQTPGTYFQYLVTHLLSQHYQVNPSERIRVKMGEDTISLTMDLIFETQKDNARYHVAVKNSTRERASEVWAHQRILDESFGKSVYKGILIGLAETKLDHKALSVIEICVPDQWRIYQQYIAQLSRIYYLDPPAVYMELNNKPPFIVVKSFGDFFYEDSIF